MSFTLVRKTDPNVTNAIINYKEIGEELLTLYYNCYDSDDLSRMGYLYHANAQFTFRNCECFGFDNWITLLKSKGVYRFTHHIIHSVVQPISSADLLILVHGTLSVNNSSGYNRFTETLLVKRDAHNRFAIYNTIFALID